MTGWMAGQAAVIGLWGALAMVLLIPALEAALPLIGVLLPGQTAVVLGGALAYHGRVPLPAILAAALIGAVAGNAIGYWAGRRWNQQLMDRIPRRLRRPRQTDRAMKLIERNSGRAVFVARFTAVLRTLIPTMCGMRGIPVKRFLIWSTLASAVWAPACVAIGFATAPALPL